ncbi:redoxin domain-containing protein [Candidatus Poriferisodalis sp.]|uniref:redoxin domain-containing protein n=1 Tax=Candidatus Poriferisodalis sp. TaxID=3101277 RepID=UPI003B516D87
MKSSLTRSVAVGVLVVGIALIVWTAVNGPEDDPVVAEAASTPTAPPQTAPGESPQTATAETAAPAPTTTTEPLEPIPVLGTAFTLSRLDGWLNTDATSLEEIREENEITVVQFWTFGCRNCKNTLDALGELYADFGDQGVEIVGVHAPEFAYEADVDNIIDAAAQLGVTWPIALDTQKHNFHVWQEGPTGYWPRVYVIDSDNQIRFDRRGDSPRKYEELYQIVERLLAET